jgi:hypothetical protein
MLQEILDNIEGILVELMDNQIDFDFDVKDKRDKFLRFDIRFFPEFIRDGGLSRYFPYLEFYGRDGKLKHYIKEALLTLDTYLKNKLMYVKVHSLFGNEGIMMSIPEFTRIEGSMATTIKIFTIGVSVNHLARGKVNRNIKERRIYSYSQFINEELKDINTNISGGRFKEIDKIYNDEDAHVKSKASGILLKDKLRKEEMDSIITALEQGAKPSDFNTSNDPKLQRILVLMNNLKFLKDKLKEDGRLQCEYCGKGPLIIYDVVASKFKNLIDSPYYKLNQDFDPEWGATCDHKDPQSLGGDKFDYSNLAVCCYRCNQRKRSMPYKQWMERIGKTNESLVVPRQPIDQMADTFIIEVFDKFDIDYCKPEDEEKMDYARVSGGTTKKQEAYWTFVFEDRDGKGGLLEKPYEQFLEICWLESELYTNVMNELLAVKSMVERRTGYTYKLKHSTSCGYGFITIETRDIYGNFLRPEENI